MTPEGREFARQSLDARLTLLQPEIRFQPPYKGWIRAIRDALGMSSRQLAKRVGSSAANIEGLEKSEVSGTIQLRSLRRVAEEMDCVLVYALVPKTSLNDAVKHRAREIAMQEIGRVAHTMRLEGQATNPRDLDARIEQFIRKHINDRDLWK